MKGGRNFLPTSRIQCNVIRTRPGSHSIESIRLLRRRQDCSLFLSDCRFLSTTTTNVPSTVDSLTHSSKELLSIAYNEARRSLEVNSNSFSPPKTPEAESSTGAEDPAKKVVQKHDNDILKAAKSLLEVSTHHGQLKVGIQAISASDVRFRRHVDVLHKAFLSLTSKCLDQATLEDPSAIHLALKLAERAGKIGLPIHTPLHHRIMETAAQFVPRDLPLMLDIGSLLIQNAPEVFASALQVLIHKEHFVLAENLFEEMPIYLTRSGVKDVFNAIREAHESADFSVRRVSSLCRLVQHLELSVQRIIIQNYRDRRLKTESQVFTDSADSPDSMDELVEAIVEYSRSTGIDNINTEDDTEAEYTLDLDVVHTADDDEVSPAFFRFEKLREETIDHATLSVLLSRVEDPRVRVFLADMVGYSYHMLSRGMMHIDNTSNLEYFADSGSSMTNHGSTTQPIPWKLPDITDQLVRMNGGAELEFTNEYEDILLEEENRLSSLFNDDGNDEGADSEFDDDYSSDNDE